MNYTLKARRDRLLATNSMVVDYAAMAIAIREYDRLLGMAKEALEEVSQCVVYGDQAKKALTQLQEAGI